MRYFFFLPVFIICAAIASSPPLLVKVLQYGDGFYVGVTNAFFSEETEVTNLQSISFVGDVMLGRHVETLMKSEGEEYPYHNLVTLSSTTWFGNFEAASPREHKQTPDFTFALSVDAKYLPALANFGFRHVGLANNHTFDFGADVFGQTQDNLRAEGIEPIGHPEHVSGDSVTYIQTQTGIVGVIAVHATQATPDFDSLKEQFDDMKRLSDVQLAFIHWGTEYEPIHSDLQEKLAHELIDLGAEAVIGHHPHVVQDIGWYKDRPIFYSLGNFIFDQYFSEEVQQGLVVEVTIVDEGVEYALQPVTSIDSVAAPGLMDEKGESAFMLSLAKRSAKEVQKGVINEHIFGSR